MKRRTDKNEIIHVCMLIAVFASSALAKRDYSVQASSDLAYEVPFLVRFAKAMTFSIIWYGAQFNIARLVFWSFFKKSKWRCERYILVSSVCASILGSLDSYNDESWFPGLAIGLVSSISASVLIFQLIRKFDTSLAALAAGATLVISTWPLMIATSLFQNVILFNTLNLSW